LKFFTFAQGDWEELRREGVECYLFLCRKARNELPESVRNYIRLGEGSDAQIRLRRRPGEAEGRPVSESLAAQIRKKHSELFLDWYDLGGVVKTPLIASRYAQYWNRFALLTFAVACDDDLMTLAPRENVTFTGDELKALLAYLNSSFAKLYFEASGRSTGGGALALEANVLEDMPILDVKSLPKEDVEHLAKLFDKLETEARRLGGADKVENIFGSELAKDLTGRENVKEGVPGLFNTVIREIDERIAEILQVEALVEPARTMVLGLVRRRLSRAAEAKPGALRGSEEQSFRGGKHRRRKSEKDGADANTTRLTDFM
jgi:hypothetical protein